MTDINWPVMPGTIKLEGWNPMVGCTKISEGCKNCYALDRVLPRMGYEPGVHICDQWLNKPVHWKAPRTVLVCLLGDLFHEDVSNNYLLEVFSKMAICQHHTFMVLTKRPERMRDFVASLRPIFSADMWPLPNIWFGVSAENQEYADKRIPILLEMKAAGNAKHVYVSLEPLLGPIDLSRWIACEGHLARTFDNPFLDLVIVGGESGPHARLCYIWWIRNIKEQCEVADTALWVKQDYGPRPGQWGRIPPELRVRQIPEVSDGRRQ